MQTQQNRIESLENSVKALENLLPNDKSARGETNARLASELALNLNRLNFQVSTNELPAQDGNGKKTPSSEYSTPILVLEEDSDEENTCLNSGGLNPHIGLASASYFVTPNATTNFDKDKDNTPTIVSGPIGRKLFHTPSHGTISNKRGRAGSSQTSSMGGHDNLGKVHSCLNTKRGKSSTQKCQKNLRVSS